MTESQYKVIFKGEILPGRDLEDVQKQLASLYQVELSQVRHLFCRKPFILKQGLSLIDARSLGKRLESTGIQVYLVEMSENQSHEVVDSREKSPTGNYRFSSDENDVLIEQEAQQLLDSMKENYSQILDKFRILKKEKKLKTIEGLFGCFTLILISFIIAGVFLTSISWIGGLLIAIIMIVVMGCVVPRWKYDYLDVYLNKFRVEEKENFPLFLAVLLKFTYGLKRTDRSKNELLDRIKRMIKAHPEGVQQFMSISQLIKAGKIPFKLNKNRKR